MACARQTAGPGFAVGLTLVGSGPAVAAPAATDASVWYSITPEATGALLVDLSLSDYTAGAIVVTGSPGSFSLAAATGVRRTCR